jgi:hypothetical protein
VSKTPADTVRRDKQLRSFLADCKNGIYNVDVKKVKYEVNNLHRTRLSRALKSRTVKRRFKEQVVEMQTQSMAFRSRIVEMKLTCVDVLFELDKHLSILKKFLKAEYAAEMKKVGSTQSDRDAFLDNLLSRPIMLKKDLENTITYADIVIADIDASDWNVMRMINAVQVKTDRKSVM